LRSSISNIDEAVRLYRLSANQGNRFGLARLARCYQFGDGVTKNIKEAYRLYELAASQGEESSKTVLRSLSKPSSPSPYTPPLNAEDLKCSFKLLLENNPEAQAYIGSCYHDGVGLEKDIKEALRLYRLSAQQGNKYGQARLATCYHYGYGVPINLDEAERLYTLAANQGLKGATQGLEILESGRQKSARDMGT